MSHSRPPLTAASIADLLSADVHPFRWKSLRNLHTERNGIPEIGERPPQIACSAIVGARFPVEVACGTRTVVPIRPPTSPP
jgi:hypothetical protein